MLTETNFDTEVYSELMSEVKKLNSEYKQIRKSKMYKVGMAVDMSMCALKSMSFSEVRKQYRRWSKGVRSKKFLGVNRKVEKDDNKIPNYFSEERIAVYTVVFGKYDNIPEPYCTPNNIDYYLVTDQNIDLSCSVWHKVDITSFNNILSKYNNVQKNRYFKMQPHLLFPNYKYSIYLDGNIQVITDLTEYIYCLNNCGLAAHMHSSRDCVYEESKAIVFAKKESKEKMDSHIEHLKNEHFPVHYGMLECNILVREHNTTCKSIMEEWLSEFMTYSKRDQISLPYVLFKNGIEIEKVGTLGNNVYENASFRITTHN